MGVPAPELIERFRHDLDDLIAPGAAVGIAVSGGPDSVALLLLAAAARPRLIRAATVDHGLRVESSAEAEAVGRLCERLGVPHHVLRPDWSHKPRTAIQEKARAARYLLLGEWVLGEQLAALVTGHHLDDQAETFLMRLARGAGVKGLAAMRGAAAVPGHPSIALLRPLLGWRRSDLGQLCADAGVPPTTDPSNDDAHFERVRVRQWLAASDLLQPDAIAHSAAFLGQADAALEWATDDAWQRVVTAVEAEVVVRPAGIPAEIRRRLAQRAVRALATEGDGCDLRRREGERLLLTLHRGGRATLRGVLCSGGDEWRFSPAPSRR